MVTIEEVRGYSRDERAILYALGTIRVLIQEGLVEGPDLLTENGLSAYELIKSNTDLQPSEEEFKKAALFLMNGGG